MKVWVDGRALTLTKKDFVAQGGEGSVYVKGKTAYKLYADAGKVIPAGKLKELGAIGEPNVIAPEQLVADKSGTPVGYTMPFVERGWALCQLFPRAFRERHGLEPKQTVDLVRRLQELVRRVHQAAALVVDLNELNVLVAPDFDDLYLIDVDSYQTAHYPATALMESVRDRHAAPGQFSELTDWFAFAIVSFQMLVGIHPYKGKHPAVVGLDARMQQDLSVLRPEVRVPRSCYPFDVIPAPLRAWYTAVLDRGERTPPPTLGSGLVVVVPTISVNKVGGFDLVEVYAFDGDIRAVWQRGDTVVALTDTGLYLDGRRVTGVEETSGAAVGFSPHRNLPVHAALANGRLSLTDITHTRHLQLELDADAVMAHDGRIYARSGDHIVEIVLTELGDRVAATPRVAANVLPHATQLFDGCAVQNLLGSTFVSLFPRAGAAYQARLAELDPYRVVDAKFDGGVLVLIAVRRTGSAAGSYDRFVIRFDRDFGRWDIRITEDVGPCALDFIPLDSGVCLSVTEDDHLELFAARRGANAVKLVESTPLGGDARLVRLDGGAGFTRGDRVYRMSMAP